MSKQNQSPQEILKERISVYKGDIIIKRSSGDTYKVSKKIEYHPEIDNITSHEIPGAIEAIEAYEEAVDIFVQRMINEINSKAESGI